MSAVVGSAYLSELSVSGRLSPAQWSHLAVCGGLPLCQGGAAGCRPINTEQIIFIFFTSFVHRRVVHHTS